MGLFSRRKMKPLPALPAPSPGPPGPSGHSAGPETADTRPPLSLPLPLPLPPPPPPYHTAQTSGVSTIGGQDSSPPYTHFRPAGYLPPPPGWHGEQSPPEYQQPPAPPTPPTVVVNQHYYVLPAPPSHSTSGNENISVGQRPGPNNCVIRRKAVGSAINLTNQVIAGVLPGLLEDVQQNISGVDQICERFNNVMTRIDRERYVGNEGDLFTYEQDSRSSTPEATSRGQAIGGKPKKKHTGRKISDHPKGQTTAVAGSILSGSYFAKVDLYANSRLPMNLPPLKLYIPTWPLLCLAAQYSERVYEKSRGKERDVQVDADLKSGTKAMVIKSVPMDHMNTIVFAVRGTATFMDWAVNLKTAPVSPAGFLDDCGNYCHAGFLSVARRMVKPVAARLHQLLQEDPARRSYSLLITGHSAGGAVAALLYAHMLATTPAAQSELTALTARFKRVHCVTFGTPPVSLLPLQKPQGRPELRKSLFLSFVNEGDPVARADRAYVKSLLELFATPAPSQAKQAKTTAKSLPALPNAENGLRDSNKKSSRISVASAKPGKTVKTAKNKSSNADSTTTVVVAGPAAIGPVWKVPPCALSNAGRIVVLRSGNSRARLKGKKTVEERLNEGVVAQIATDEQLRTVVWGDPVCHLMKLYAGRLEILAVNAVTAKGY